MAQSYPVTYNNDLEVNTDSATGVLENTRQVRIQKKLCHVVGVYREYTAGDPNVTPPENTAMVSSMQMLQITMVREKQRLYLSTHYTVSKTMCNGIHYGADGMTVNSIRIHAPVTTTFKLTANF